MDVNDAGERNTIEKTDNANPDKEQTDPKATQASSETDFYLPRRFIVVALCWTGLFVIHAMRVNVGITVVTILDVEAHTKVGSEEAVKNLPKVAWNSKMIGFLHSIFYVGYIISQIPGGYISRKSYVAKLVVHFTVVWIYRLCI